MKRPRYTEQQIAQALRDRQSLRPAVPAHGESAAAR